MKTLPIFLLIVFIIGASRGWSSDQELEKALSLANQGQTAAAIKILKKIHAQSSGESRVNLCLGLLLQSVDKPMEAISFLERAVESKSSAEGFYALGLLYEAQMVAHSNASWKNKAIKAWTDFLSHTGSGHPRRKTAERHLRRLREEK